MQRAEEGAGTGSSDPFAERTSPVGEPTIKVEGVSKRFNLHIDRPRSLKERVTQGASKSNEFWAVEDVSLDVSPGSTFGLVGHNGSGKSTLLRLIAGIYRPTAGNVTVHGRVAALLELGAGFHPDLTGRENVYLNGAILGLSRGEIDDRMESIIEFSGLGDFVDSPVKIYSSGMYVRLGFAVAVNVDPDVLLIDEVVAVGDEDFQRQCFDHLHQLRRDGTTIVIVTHGLGLVRDICDRAAWLDHGKLQIEGDANDVVDAYLDNVNEASALSSPTPAHAAEPADDGHSDDRPGTGTIRFSSVEVVDDDDQPVRSVLNGDPAKIRLTFEMTEPVHDPIIAVHIHRADGTYVCGIATDLAKIDLGVLSGQQTVDIDIPRMGLLAGTYELSVLAHSSDHSELFDQFERAQYIAIYNTSATSATGLVDLDARWQLA